MRLEVPIPLDMPECQDLAKSEQSRALRFHFASGYFITQQLACMLNSLVRVSRRVRWAAVYSPPNLQCTTLKVFGDLRHGRQSRSCDRLPPPRRQSTGPNAYAGLHADIDRLTDERAELPAVRHRESRGTKAPRCRLGGRTVNGGGVQATKVHQQPLRK